MTDDLPPITPPAEYVIPAWRNAYLAAFAPRREEAAEQEQAA